MKQVWNKIFIEIALRAIRKVHIEYGMWGLGQGTEKSATFQTLNQGPGIEVAQELAVCAAISQEFINSRFTNGLYINGEARHYEINREVCFKLGKEKIFIDIFIDRWRNKKNKISYYKYPALLQVKRAHYFKPEIATGERGKKYTNWSSIKNDIINLINLRKDLNDSVIGIDKYNGKLEGAFLYTLFWGTSSQKKEHIPFSKRLKEKIKKKLSLDISSNLEIRCMPLKWDVQSLEVKEWLWIALLEIAPYKVAPSKGDQNWFEI